MALLYNINDKLIKTHPTINKQAINPQLYKYFYLILPWFYTNIQISGIEYNGNYYGNLCSKSHALKTSKNTSG